GRGRRRTRNGPYARTVPNRRAYDERRRALPEGRRRRDRGPVPCRRSLSPCRACLTGALEGVDFVPVAAQTEVLGPLGDPAGQLLLLDLALEVLVLLAGGGDLVHQVGSGHRVLRQDRVEEQQRDQAAAEQPDDEQHEGGALAAHRPPDGRTPRLRARVGTLARAGPGPLGDGTRRAGAARHALTGPGLTALLPYI